MPIGFLPPADRDRLNHFPAQIPDDDLRAFFLLSETDQQVINHQREAHTRLGFALQLCALRYLGFAPDDLSATPEEVLLYVARQLDVPATAIHAYGQRVKTRTTHIRREQIVRPGLTRLGRLVATARHTAHTETLRPLTPLLTSARSTLLDAPAGP